MSNQLKLLLYIIFIAGIFYFLQNKFDLFDISFVEEGKISDIFKSDKGEANIEGTLREIGRAHV